MSLIRASALPFVLAAFTSLLSGSSGTAAPKPQVAPQLITVELQYNQIKHFYARPAQSAVEPGGFDVGANLSADWTALGFKPGDVVLSVNGRAAGERMSIDDGVHHIELVRNKKPVVLRVIVHPPPRKSYTLDESAFERLVERLVDPTNDPMTTPVKDASGPSGVRIISTMLCIYVRCDVGDLIRTIDHQPMRTNDEVTTALKGLRIGTTEVMLERMGHPITLTLVRKAPLDMTGVRKISATKYEVTRVFADAIRADTDLLARKLSSTPVIKNGKPHGYSIYEIMADAPAKALGFLDGDVVLDVDGNRIDSYSDIRTATEQLEHVNSVAVHIERKGKPMTLTYVIR